MDIFSLGEEDFVPFCIFYHTSRKSRFERIFLDVKVNKISFHFVYFITLLGRVVLKGYF